MVPGSNPGRALLFVGFFFARGRISDHFEISTNSFRYFFPQRNKTDGRINLIVWLNCAARRRIEKKKSESRKQWASEGSLT